MENSDISSQVYIPGYTIPSMDILARWHAYKKSTRGEPSVSKGQINLSQFLGGVYDVLHPDCGFLLCMMFQGVFASVGVAYLGIIIQNESRFDLIWAWEVFFCKRRSHLRFQCFCCPWLETFLSWIMCMHTVTKFCVTFYLRWCTLFTWASTFSRTERNGGLTLWDWQSLG
jgi:hypothetical protein